MAGLVNCTDVGARNQSLQSFTVVRSSHWTPHESWRAAFAWGGIMGMFFDGRQDHHSPVLLLDRLEMAKER